MDVKSLVGYTVEALGPNFMKFFIFSILVFQAFKADDISLESS